MENIKIKDNFIKLDQLMKLANMVTNGGEAKYLIKEGNVKVNGEIETRRGKKLVAGDIIEFQKIKVQICN